LLQTREKLKSRNKGRGGSMHETLGSILNTAKLKKKKKKKVDTRLKLRTAAQQTTS
jgi:hypothetical protein